MRADHLGLDHRAGQLDVEDLGAGVHAAAHGQHDAGVGGAAHLLDGFLQRLAHYRRTVEMGRSEEHTSELQSLMRISYAVFCLKKKKQTQTTYLSTTTIQEQHKDKSKIL